MHVLKSSFIFVTILLTFFSSCSTHYDNAIITPIGILHNHDVQGKDLTSIGRYDEMIRCYYSNISEENSAREEIIYFKKGDIFEELKGYLIARMDYAEYKQIGNAKSTMLKKFKIIKEYSEKFNKEKDNVSITIALVNLNHKKYTFLDIVHTAPVIERASNATAETNFENAHEVAINNDFAKQINKMFKQKLNTMYNGVKLVNVKTDTYNSIENAQLTYLVNRKVRKNDDSILGDMLQKEGYQILSDTIGSEISISTMKNDEPNQPLKLNAKINEHTILITASRSLK